MLGLTKKLKDAKTNENELTNIIKSRGKAKVQGSKHVIKNYSTKRFTEEKRTPEIRNEVYIKRTKSAKKPKESSIIKAAKTKRKPFQKNFFLPYKRGSLQKHNICEEYFPKEISRTILSDKNTVGDTNRMIFVSLDFIEECQKYKKKFMKPMCGQELENLKKSLQNISSYHKRYLSSKRIFPMSKQITGIYKDKHCENLEEKKLENFPSEVKENAEETKQNSSPNEDLTHNNVTYAEVKENTNEIPVKDELLTLCTKMSTETYSVKDSSNVQPISADVSTVDKKYIELLLSIVNCKEKKQKMNVENRNDNLGQLKDKKKIPGKLFFENKIKMGKEKHFNGVLDKDEKIRKTPENRLKSNGLLASQENTTLCRLIRDLTKSEMQIQFQKGKIACGDRFSETENHKKTAYSKPEVSDNRKKRKTRNKVMKKNNQEIVETPFPCEISNASVVTELWRREPRKKSDNSLSSQSASTVQQSDEICNKKTTGLESYKILRKIVEEEIKTICKKFVDKKIENNKTSLNNKNNNDQTECSEEIKIIKNICQELRTKMAENPTELLEVNENKMNEAIKKILNEEQTDSESNPQYGEVKKKKKILLNFFDKYESKDLDVDLLDNSGKLPSEIVKNWSIFHRLEKAFLALGTPTFPNTEMKNSNILKIKGQNEVKKSDGCAAKVREGSTILRTKRLQKSSENDNVSDKKENKNSKLHKGTNQLSVSSPVRTKVLQSSRNDKTKTDNKESVKGPVKESVKESAKEPRKGPAKEPGKEPAKEPGKEPGKEPRKELGKESVKGPVREPGKESGRESSRMRKLHGLQNLKTERQPEPSATTANRTPERENRVRQTRTKVPAQKTNNTETKALLPRKTTSKPKAESQLSKRNTKEKTRKQESPANSNQTPKATPPDKKDETLTEPEPIKILITDTTDSKQNEVENLERKETFYVLPLKNPFDIKAEISKSCHEIENIKKDSFPLALDMDPIEPISNYNLEDFSDVSRIDNDIENDSIKQTKSSVTDKTPSRNKPFETPKILDDKEDLINNQKYTTQPENEILAGSKENEKTLTIEEISQQILSEKNVVNEKDVAVKERSILSMRNDLRQGKSCVLLEEKLKFRLNSAPDNFADSNPAKDIEILLDTYVENSPDSLSVMCPSTSTFDIAESVSHNKSLESESKMFFQSIRSIKHSDVFADSTSMFSPSFCGLEEQNVSEEKKRYVKNQPVWEQDIKQYRAIVKDIMNHYKRIDGLLKENEHSRSLPHDSCANLNSNEIENSQLRLHNQNLLEMNIHEYRKKILSEYKALSIFEYKKDLERKRGTDNSCERRRNLAFVKALKTEMDLDVKDFQPNIQKILDSQLYVDDVTQIRCKRKESCLKSIEKNSSLQEISVKKSLKPEEECLRTISTPKNALALPRAVCFQSNSDQNVPATVKSDIGMETLLLKI